MGGDDETKGTFAATLLPPFLAVCAVTTILTLLFAWLGPAGSDTKVLGAHVSSSAPPAASPTPKPPASSKPAPSPSESSPAATTTQSQSKPARTGPQVVVLNQSGGTSLAQKVGARLRKAGWTVKQTGTFRGSVSTTTVYYPRGLRAEASKLAKDLQGDPRVKERFSNLSATRLTVVLTNDYGH